MKATQKHWKQHLAQWQKSKLSKTAYCKQHDLNYHRFLYWNKKFSNAASLIPVKVAPPKNTNTSALCFLELPSGHKLCVQSREALLLVLEQLA